MYFPCCGAIFDSCSCSEEWQYHLSIDRGIVVFLNFQHKKWFLSLLSHKMKVIEFMNSGDPDETAHYEPPHLNQHFFPPNLQIVNMILLG